MSGLNKHHLILCLYFLIISFQETYSSESGKLGYGSKCTPPPQQSKRILNAPQNAIRLDNPPANLHNPSFHKTLSNQHLIHFNSASPNEHKEMSSDFKSQLRKKLRRAIKMERVKREVDEEQERSSTTGANELTTATVMMSGNDKSSDSPSVSSADTTTTTSVSLDETAPPSSPQPSSAVPLNSEESTRRTAATTEPILLEAMTDTSQPSFAMSSPQPDDNGRGGNMGSSLITPNSDGSKSTSTSRTTDEIVPSPSAAAAADQEESEKDTRVTPGPILLTTSVSDSLSIEPVLTTTSGPGENGGVDGISSSTDASLEGPWTSLSSSSAGGGLAAEAEEASTTRGSSRSNSEEAGGGTAESTEMPTTAKEMNQQDGTTIGLILLTTEKAMSTIAVPETAGETVAQPSGVEMSTVLPHEDKSIVNNPPSSSPAEGGAEQDVTKSDPLDVQKEVSTSPAETAAESEGPSPESPIAASQVTPEATPPPEEEVKSMSTPESPAEPETITTTVPSSATTAAEAPAAEEAKSVSTSPPEMSPNPPVDPPATSTEAVTQAEAVGSTAASSPPTSAPRGEGAPEPITTQSSATAAKECPTTIVEITPSAPEISTPSPPEATEAPAETTEAPPRTTEAPPKTTEAPPEATQAPPETTQAPPETTQTPPETTQAPPETTQAPPETTEVPPPPKTTDTPPSPPKTTEFLPPTPPSSTTAAPTTTTPPDEPSSESPPPTPHTSEVSSPSDCDSSLSLECSTEVPHVCVCTSGLTWNETTEKCVPTSPQSFNGSCSGNSSCQISSFLVCRDSRCRCEDDAYQRWEESSGSCVSTAGTQSKCSLKEDNYGRQLGCVTHATCRRQEGGGQDDWGLCECGEGFENNWLGYCENSGNPIRTVETWILLLIPSILILFQNGDSFSP